jgi:hypothetical protein
MILLQRDAWKRNRSDVCAWKYHTEILELQRDAWKRNRSDAKKVLPRMGVGLSPNRNIEVTSKPLHPFYFSSTHLSVILIFLYDSSKHIQHFYFSSTHLSVILIFLYDTSKHIQHFYFSSISL